MRTRGGLPRERRDDVQALRELPIVTPAGAQLPLGQIAEVVIVDGPPLLKSENARLNSVGAPPSARSAP